MNNLVPLILATLILVSIPGPNVALIVARSLRYGVLAGFTTTFGTTAGVAIQLLMVLTGIAVLVGLAAQALMLIKWAGAIYLIVLGVRTWRTPVSEYQSKHMPSTQRLIAQGLTMAVVNPKTLLFNAAFLPQFLSADAGLPEFGLVAGTYLLVLMFGDMLWAIFASIVAPRLPRMATIANKVSGGLIGCAGLGLALTQREL
jgi:threonine/homoserine/homoserine lactone efflux protein